MEVVHLNKVSKLFADRKLFELSSLTVNSGDQIVLIGANGVGKSTLLKMIAGIDDDYQGQILVRGEVAYVPQLKEISSQSGGEQVRAYLLAAFRQRADLLILDEPSTNLDQEGIAWLIQQLRRFRGTLLMVSHDRYFINQLATKIWYLDAEAIKVYAGNYNDFEQVQLEERSNQEREFKVYQKKVDNLRRSAEAKERQAQKLTKRKKNISFSEWKARSLAGSYDGKQRALSKSAQNLQGRLDKLEQVEQPRDKKGLKFKEIGNHLPSGGQLVHLKEGQLSVDGKFLFSYSDWVLKSGDKIILSGANQAGKTTFVRQLLKQSLEGVYSPRLRSAYYAQNFEALDLDKSALANLQETSAQDRAVLINLLTALNLTYDQIFQPLHHLSGGERVKVQLAKVLSADANLLILDEPTNYLDVQTIQSLENFLSDYQGAVILISHDRVFLDRIAAREYAIIDQKLQEL